MKTIGIIAEYNPFHKGHAYMLRKAKEESGADRVVIVMSGSFVQRGEPALFDQWTRAEAALLNGADIVLKLPAVFSAANAETFARGAVRILEESGVADVLCFGSESGDLLSLQKTADLLDNETEAFQTLLKKGLSEGLSYPSARAKALEAAAPDALLSNPNDILALEYLRALRFYNSQMQPMTIKREGSYHSEALTEGFASASAVRKALKEDRLAEALAQLPENTHALYQKALAEGKAPVFSDAFSPALQYRLRMASAEELRDIHEVTEGLENRILRSLEHCTTFSEVTDFVKSKRYTHAKIQRILLHILLGIKTEDVRRFLDAMPYLRVLGFRKESADLLGRMTREACRPVLTNPKKAASLLDAEGLRLWELEKRADDLYFMACPSPACRRPNQDLTTPLAMVK